MHVVPLIRKEFVVELRRKAVISGLGLYLFNLVFICYITFSLGHSTIIPVTWSALFWLSILFSMTSSMAKSFIGEKRGVQLYLYSLAGAQDIILSKIIYNFFLGILLTLGGYALFTIFISNPVADTGVFLTTLALTSWGFAASLSLISAVAAKANNSAVLMAILSFPILIGILLMAIKLSKNAIDGLGWYSSTDELINLSAINSIATALAYILFPYIWRS